MRSLSLALYCEGTTDQRFLPTIIRRTARRILAQREGSTVEVLPVDIIAVVASRRDHSILQAAYKADHYQALIVHADADYPTAERARRERFDPGYALVQQCQDKICKNLVPIIPVYMTEAWMLADHEKLCEAIRTTMRASELGLPVRTKQVETDAHPKETLKQALRIANAHRTRQHGQIEMNMLYEMLPSKIRLHRLQGLSAYQQFVNDLTQALEQLDLIR